MGGLHSYLLSQLFVSLAGFPSCMSVKSIFLVFRRQPYLILFLATIRPTLYTVRLCLLLVVEECAHIFLQHEEVFGEREKERGEREEFICIKLFLGVI